MPASLFFSQSSNLKKYRLSILLLFFPLFFFGQTLTGLWTGALSNDSTTIRKDQLFEIALTEYKGKVYGYSRSEFIVNDTLYYIVKRVKGTIEGDVCEVTDDEIIAYNFRGKLDKGIKVTSTFRRNSSDSAWYLAGSWKTNATKKYYSVTGKVDLEQEKDLTRSKIFPHLEELKIANEIAFYRERSEVSPIVQIAKPEKIKTEYTFNSDPAPAMAVAAPSLQRADPEAVEPDVKKPDNTLARTETKDIDASPVTLKPVATSKTVAVNKPQIIIPQEKNPPAAEPSAVKNTKPVSGPAAKNIPGQNITIAKTNPAPANNNTEIKKPEPNPATQKTNPVVAVAPVPAAPKEPQKSVEELTKKVAVIEGRKSEFSQVVDFKSDSLVLSLYDNGEIDGDTVSVIMNGETIMAKQGLKGSAIRKTIYIKPGQNEDFTLVLFADNLGKYPPNTGLLVVHDGEDIYHLRFSSDFQKSSGIVFRRKK